MVKQPSRAHPARAHHIKAAEHHEQAAIYHREAAGHYASGHDETAAHYAGDGVFAVTLVGHGFEGPELIERVERLALGVFGEAVGFCKTVHFDDAGTGAFLASFFCLTRSFRARKRRLPAWMP